MAALVEFKRGRVRKIRSKGSSTHEIKLPDKLRAAERICKIIGWDAPDQTEDVTKPKPPDGGKTRCRQRNTGRLQAQAADASRSDSLQAMVSAWPRRRRKLSLQVTRGLRVLIYVRRHIVE